MDFVVEHNNPPVEHSSSRGYFIPAETENKTLIGVYNIFIPTEDWGLYVPQDRSVNPGSVVRVEIEVPAVGQKAYKRVFADDPSGKHEPVVLDEREIFDVVLKEPDLSTFPDDMRPAMRVSGYSVNYKE